MKLQQIKKSKSLKFHLLAMMVLIIAFTMPLMTAFASWSVSNFGSDAGLSSGLTVADSGSNWSYSGTTFTATKAATSGTCSNSAASTSTLTITNNSGYDAELTFSTTTSNDGTITYGGQASGAGTITLSNGQYVTILGKTGTDNTSDCTFTVTITGFAVQIDYDIEFTGEMTATQDGAELALDEVHTLVGLSTVTLTADATNDDDDTFLYWLVNGKAVSTSTTYDWTVSGSETGTTIVTPYYGDGDTLYFSDGGDIYFDNLQTALDSSSTVVLTADYTLPENMDYTVPAGTTLVVPKDSTDTGAYTYSYGVTSGTQYMTLTVPETTTITVNGALAVGGTQTVYNTNNAGVSGNNWGQIELEGNIIIKSGASLYAYGYIEGNGMVTVESGASSYEYLQISSFQGGSLTYDIYSETFPTPFYYIQNVQTDFKVESGANLYAYWAAYMNSTSFNGMITYMDNTTSGDSMFHLTDGYMIRTFDPNTYRMDMELYGSLSTGSVDLTLKYIFSFTISSDDTELPLPGNMGLYIADGGKFTVNHDLKLLPGVHITIDEGGEMVLGSGGSLYIYYSDDYDSSTTGYAWTKYNLMVMSEYKEILAGVNAGTITNATYYSSYCYRFDWGDTQIVNNGVISYSGGKMYTSASEDGTTITGTGVMDFTNDTGTTTTITEYTINGGDVDETVKVSFSRPVLNIDGTATSSVKGYAYQGTEDGIWYLTNGTVSVVANTTTTLDDNQIAVDVVLTPDYSVTDADFAVTVSYTDTDLSLASGSTTISVSGKDFVAGEEYVLETLVFTILDTCGGSANIEVAAGTWTLGDYTFATKFNESFTYYPTFTITYSDGTASVNYTAGDEDITLPVLEADAEGNEFLGWYVGDSTEEVTTLVCSEYSGDLYLTAVWDATVTYTITYSESVDEDAVTSYTNKDTETITLPTLEKDYYTFGGWYETDDETVFTTIDPATAQNYDLTAKWTAVVYTISFSDDVADVTYTVEDGTITLPTPEKDGYGFAGWYVEGAEDTIFTTIDATTASDLTLTAKWSLNIITYTISFSDEVEDMTFTNETTETITLPTLEDTDEYTFDGWYVTDDETKEIITEIAPATAQDYDLTALWSEVVKAEMNLTVELRADGYSSDGDNNIYADIYEAAGITFTGGNEEGYTLTVDEAEWTAWAADDDNATALAAMQNGTNYYVGIQFADNGDKVISAVGSSSADADNYYIIYIPVASETGCYATYEYTYTVTYADGDTAEIKVTRELIGAPEAIADGVVDAIAAELVTAINAIINDYGMILWATENMTEGYSYDISGDDYLGFIILDDTVTIYAMYNDMVDTIIEALGKGSNTITNVKMGESDNCSVVGLSNSDVYNLVANSGLTGANGTSAISGNDTLGVLEGQTVDLVLTDVNGTAYTYEFGFVLDESLNTDPTDPETDDPEEADDPVTDPTIPDVGGDDEQTTTEVTDPEDTTSGDALSTGDTIEVVITPSSDESGETEDEETVILSVTIVTNDESNIGNTDSSDDTTGSDETDETETTGYNALADNTQMIVLSVVVENDSVEDSSDDDSAETVTPAETDTTDDAGNTYVEGYFYDGQAMYYSPLYEAYVYIFDETDGFDASLVTVGEAILLEYDGNVSGDEDGEVSALDATLVYRLSLGTWSDDYDTIDMKSRLEADVNGDGVVDINDALYILKLTWD